MIRLGISVEGPTEREFVSRVLGPHLSQFNVWTRAVDMGGNVSLDKIRGILPALLGNFDHVSTLYDFYGFKRRGGLTVDGLQMAISEQVTEERRHRLIPYVQLHEFEALLFAVPEYTVSALGGSDNHLSILREAVNSCGSPEAVNDSPQTSPSHRLLSIFGSAFDKKLHGPQIILTAGLAAVRAECPRFDSWIASLQQLGAHG